VVPGREGGIEEVDPCDAHSSISLFPFILLLAFRNCSSSLPGRVYPDIQGIVPEKHEEESGPASEDPGLQEESGEDMSPRGVHAGASGRDRELRAVFRGHPLS
jgi:hypothetical protein